MPAEDSPETLRHVTVAIDRPYDAVYGFLKDPANFPLWASGLGDGFRHVTAMDWQVETPMGPMTVRFSAPNEFGVLDHTVIPENGAPMRNPMRAIPTSESCAVVFTLLRRAGMSDRAFEADADWIARDLATLKKLLEQG